MPRDADVGNSSACPQDLWEAHARQLLHDLMYAARVRGWKDMSRRLADVGIDVNPKVLANKVNRGRFGATLLLQFMSALRVEAVKGLWTEFPPPGTPGGSSAKQPGPVP